MIRFVSGHWAPATVSLNAPSVLLIDGVLEAVARGAPDAPPGKLGRARA